jgi:hypothetical protein
MTLLIDLDDINLRTARLAEMARFCETVLGLATGPRPAEPAELGGAGRPSPLGAQSLSQL